MLIGRVRTAEGIRWVRRDGERMPTIEDPFTAFAAGRTPRDAGEDAEGAVVAPCEPLLVVGIAQNGPEHPSPVQAWLKSPRSVTASDTPVRLRRDAGATVAEGEIAVVLGRDTDGLTAENAHEYVLGVTAVNDLSSPDRGAIDPRNFESKGGADYTPLGPWIDTDAAIDDTTLTVAVDGEIAATTGAKALPVAIRECLAYVASWTPLGPGDVIMTGAPHSQAPVSPGQTVTITVGAVELRTPFV